MGATEFTMQSQRLRQIFIENNQIERIVNNTALPTVFPRDPSTESID